MALFKSALITQASGSIGGMTLSHNSSGMYMRARSIPTNPNTTLQQVVRNAMSQLVTRWSSVLTPAQRSGWDLYAANTPTTNALGNSFNMSGQNWYVACNTPRVQPGNAPLALAPPLDIVDDSPGIFDRGDFTTPTFAVSASGGYITTFTNTDDWANEAGSALLIYQGRPANQSRKFFKGPWRLTDVVPGDPTPPTSPEATSILALSTAGGYLPLQVDMACWLAFAVTRADGRLTTRRVVGPELVV